MNRAEADRPAEAGDLASLRREVDELKDLLRASLSAK